jgi:hypothetical protein
VMTIGNTSFAGAPRSAPLERDHAACAPSNRSFSSSTEHTNA